MVFVIVVLGVSAVGAFAYFSAARLRSRSANAGSSQALTISPGTPTSFLFPGGESDVKVSIDNPNGFAVTIPSLELDTDPPIDHSGLEGDLCTVAHADLAFTASAATLDNGGSGWTAPASDSITIDLPDAVSMGIDAANGCQDATFTVYLKVGT